MQQSNYYSSQNLGVYPAFSGDTQIYQQKVSPSIYHAAAGTMLPSSSNLGGGTPGAGSGYDTNTPSTVRNVAVPSFSHRPAHYSPTLATNNPILSIPATAKCVRCPPYCNAPSLVLPPGNAKSAASLLAEESASDA